MSMPTTFAPRCAQGTAVVPSPEPTSRTSMPSVTPSVSTSASPLSRIVAAIRVKSPFSQRSLFGLLMGRSSHRRCEDVDVPARSLVTLPERLVRAAAAILGGAVHETAQVVLPRFVRQSRFYEATAKNVLRITIELVGGVQGETKADEPSVGRLAVRKGAGNVVELGSI